MIVAKIITQTRMQITKEKKIIIQNSDYKRKKMLQSHVTEEKKYFKIILKEKNQLQIHVTEKKKYFKLCYRKNKEGYNI